MGFETVINIYDDRNVALLTNDRLLEVASFVLNRGDTIRDQDRKNAGRVGYRGINAVLGAFKRRHS
jgi:hypothetical protein